MDAARFKAAETYMRQCMQHAVHDTGHVYRVVYAALRLLKSKPEANAEVVLLAALLHDIGRREAALKKGVKHAALGADMAWNYLRAAGWDEATAAHVRDCIATHSRKGGRQPATLEAKILYDADKLDLTGAVGVARALLYGAEIDEPLYRVGANGLPTSGKQGPPSLLREYHRRLKGIKTIFYTKKASKLAHKRQQAMDAYFKALKQEVHSNYKKGTKLLREALRNT